MRETWKLLEQREEDDTARGEIGRRRIARTRSSTRRRALIALVAFAALAAAPGVASAADTAHRSEVGAQSLTALDGTVVQITGTGSSARLMKRTPDGTVSPVVGAPQAIYRSVDLGRDAAGRLVLTYIRCSDFMSCRAYIDDLAGRRVSFKQLAPKHCRLTTAPARWGSRVAYGLTCRKLHGPPHVFDPIRSGLFVRKGDGAPKRLRIPADAVNHVNRVDLRKTIVGAVSQGNRSYAFSQTVNATQMRSMRITNKDELEAFQIVGMSLGAHGRLWTLVIASHFEAETVRQVISRRGTTVCEERRYLSVSPDFGPVTLVNRASSIAVDDHTVHLATAAGVVTHQFSPTSACH